MIYAVCSHGYGVCSEKEPKLEMEKVLFLFAADDSHWADLVLRADAFVQEYDGYGSQESEKEVQGQKVCGRMLQREHFPGGGDARMGVGRPV